MEKIGKSPDIKEHVKQQTGKKGGKEGQRIPHLRRTLNSSPKDAKKGTPVAGKQAPINADHHSIARYVFFAIFDSVLCFGFKFYVLCLCHRCFSCTVIAPDSCL